MIAPLLLAPAQSGITFRSAMLLTKYNPPVGCGGAGIIPINGGCNPNMYQWGCGHYFNSHPFYYPYAANGNFTAEY